VKYKEVILKFHIALSTEWVKAILNEVENPTG